MRTSTKIVGALAPLAVLLSGCVIESPPSPLTTVELVNSTVHDVRPNLYTSGSATDVAGLLVTANLRSDFTSRPFPELRAGETATLRLECADVQSIGVDAPTVFNATLLAVTTSADRIFLLRGADFECGATVRFTYSEEGEVFRATVEVR